MSHPITKQAEGPLAVLPERLVLGRASDDGTPSGAFDITGDYSVTPAEFYIESPPGFTWYMRRLDVFIQGAGNVTANGYGPITALTNGLVLVIRNPAGGDAAVPLLARSTGEWKSIPGTVLTILESGPGDNFLNVELTFDATSGSPVVLREGYRLVVVAQDDFTGLSAHFVNISGFAVEQS